MRGGGGFSGAGGSSLPSLAFIWTGFSRASPRTAIRGSVASRAIAPIMRPPSERSISAAWTLSGSAPRANSANARENVASEGTCARRSKAEDAAQGLVDVEALEQGAGAGNAQDRLGHESSREGATVLGRPARRSGRVGNEGFEADYVEGGDETTQRFGDGIDILTYRREQITLDVAPAPLHRVERVVSHDCS
ncbi:MAG TPA: hypothetical protein VEH77_12575 [Roseiarcus sp.]|nr:hypothetical protein [Roseiarcus sp.]